VLRDAYLTTVGGGSALLKFSQTMACGGCAGADLKGEADAAAAASAALLAGHVTAVSEHMTTGQRALSAAASRGAQACATGARTGRHSPGVVCSTPAACAWGPRQLPARNMLAGDARAGCQTWNVVAGTAAEGAEAARAAALPLLAAAHGRVCEGVRGAAASVQEGAAQLQGAHPLQFFHVSCSASLSFFVGGLVSTATVRPCSHAAQERAVSFAMSMRVCARAGFEAAQRDALGQLGARIEGFASRQYARDPQAGLLPAPLSGLATTHPQQPLLSRALHSCMFCGDSVKIKPVCCTLHGSLWFPAAHLVAVCWHLGAPATGCYCCSKHAVQESPTRGSSARKPVTCPL
jgi:hypothetical protein